MKIYILYQNTILGAASWAGFWQYLSDVFKNLVKVFQIFSQTVPGSEISSRYEFLQLMNHSLRKASTICLFPVMNSFPFNAFVATITWGDRSPVRLQVTIAGHFFGCSVSAFTILSASNLSLVNFIDSGLSPIISKTIRTDLNIRIPAGSIADG